ncbi:ATP-binding protein [Cellulomonas shaoxiangyii]|uniref:ATP-binding protein n=1 Tax=Cellulomonas shaoxiangyii TaxID=2566013 RepID=A0A4P7SLA3_9CELL|nr:ATP-binding protein [Cellulomonas shaoxiangyii]QCB93564.1 ATP-binding protein [Cellulomonas shaoxiangyii]TGY86886.1 ATP-binding protein [Cellulomonas shaoxiangyii]
MADRRDGHDHDLPSSRPPRGPHRLGHWQVDDLAGLTRLRRAVHAAVVAHAGRGHTPPPAADLVALLVSELTTNALRHGHAPALVDLSTDGAAIVLDVADHDTATRPVVAGPRAPGEGGFGLLIARRVADEVGWYRTRTTKHVWAVVAQR